MAGKKLHMQQLHHGYLKSCFATLCRGHCKCCGGCHLDDLQGTQDAQHWMLLTVQAAMPCSLMRGPTVEVARRSDTAKASAACAIGFQASGMTKWVVGNTLTGTRMWFMSDS